MHNKAPIPYRLCPALHKAIPADRGLTLRCQSREGSGVDDEYLRLPAEVSQRLFPIGGSRGSTPHEGHLLKGTLVGDQQSRCVGGQQPHQQCTQVICP